RMENTASAAEADPLKRADDGGEMPSSTELRKKSCKEVLGFTKLTHWRTAVFFLSLFLCLTIVFAFSFIIPCPVRPQYLISWNRTFLDAATYDFLAIEDTNRDKVNDILFVLQSSEGSQNNTCTGAGLPSPCVFFIAVDGTDGSALWECPLDPGFHWAQCGLVTNTLVGDRQQCVLVQKLKFSITNVLFLSGSLVWRQPQPPGLPSTTPVLSLPDLDGDKVGEVALVMSDSSQMAFLSGKTGLQLGSAVVLDSTETANQLLHLSAAGSAQRVTAPTGLALWRLAAKAKPVLVTGHNGATTLRENCYNRCPDSIQARSSGNRQIPCRRNLIWLPNLLPGFLIVIKWLQCVLCSRFCRKPSFGHFNKDGTLEVVLEDEVGHHKNQVVILDGTSGALLWEVTLLATPNSPIPASIRTTNFYSIFVFWGNTFNDSVSVRSRVPEKSDRHIYMLHPLYSQVLLESPRPLGHIVTFKATLLERGRHAAYILLTGPATQGVRGTVVLSKRKLKQDVPLSEVRCVGTDGCPEADDAIKEAFSRLRFSN
uniref:Family with sequence similarity 234 member A n=1 Tax=Tetraodon nigroviridis TaxID=99883 RepID=H3BW15_TETNG